MSKVEFDRYYELLEEMHLLKMAGDLDKWADVKAILDQEFPKTENETLDHCFPIGPKPHVNWLEMLYAAN